jgi:release factor glutamine methyltransferase
MKTIGEILKLSTGFLSEKKIDRSRRIAEQLVSHALRLKKMDLYLQFDKPVIEKELSLIRELVKRASKGEPIEYITGEIEFFGCHIKTDPRALIPRPETEILVEKISKRAQKGVLWDLCTGSGCIGIALKKSHPELEVTLSDLSAEALQLAAENVQANQVEVNLLQGDLFAPFIGKKADWIVCNPPYLSEAEYVTLDPSVKDFEPRMALVGGVRGLEFYERFKREMPLFLNPGAQVFFEIGASQGSALQALFPEGELQLDWASLPRFFTFCYEGKNS